MSDRLAIIQASDAMQRLVGNAPAFATEGYDADCTTWDSMSVLVVGAGGIGCELLHLLAMSGFKDITVIDMDTIELSNLNRQFLFREGDIGKPKSTIAAARVSARCPGVDVKSICGRVEEQSDVFYRSFDIIVLGLDSVPARLWMNRKVASLATWEICDKADDDAEANREAEGEEEEGNQRQSQEERRWSKDVKPRTAKVLRITSAIPLIDTGTEGFEAHCRIVDMSHNKTPCIECLKYLFDTPSTSVPMCTLENIPRVPQHCVLFIQFKTWPDERPDEPLDADNAEHIRWVTERALARQKAFNIAGAPIDDMFTVGVVKNVVPAVGFTNSMVAGQAVTEVLKILTGVAPVLDNCTNWGGRGDGGFLGRFKQENNLCENCSVCGPRPVVELSTDMSPIEVAMAVLQRGREKGIEVPAGAEENCTLSLRFSITADHKAEVYLQFRPGNPMAFPISGYTLGEVMEMAGYGDFLSAWCSKQSKRVLVICDCADRLTVTASSTCTRA